MDMPYSVLVDVTRCIGCQGCQVACKNWNDRPSGLTELGDTLAAPPDMDAGSYTVVKFSEGAGAHGSGWRFTKAQCMHCVEPACAAACPAGALVKDGAGPVVYKRSRCIGCRYCMLACPFTIPKFEWDKAIPSVRKCTFCAERITRGMEPACVKSCPAGALTFGTRDKMLRAAGDRIKARPADYVDHIYGRDEAGGTSWLYISDTDFGRLYLRGGLKPEGYARYSYGVTGKAGFAAAGVAALLTGLYFISRRRQGMDGGDGGGDGEGGA